MNYPSSPLKYDITLGHEDVESVRDAYSTFGQDAEPGDQAANAYTQFVRKYGAYTVNVIEIYAVN